MRGEKKAIKKFQHQNNKSIDKMEMTWLLQKKK